MNMLNTQSDSDPNGRDEPAPALVIQRAEGILPLAEADKEEDSPYERFIAISEKLKPKRNIFLKAYVESFGQMNKAARIAGVGLSTAYMWRSEKKGDLFDQCWQAAQELVIDAMEGEVRRRAMEGNRRYKYTTRGEPIMDPRTGEQAYDDVQSDLLAIFMLKAAKPEKYRDYSGPAQTTIVGKSITLHQGAAPS